MSTKQTPGPYTVKVKYREPAPDVFLMGGDCVSIIARQVAVKGLHTKENFNRIANALNAQPDLIIAIEGLIAEVNRHIGNPDHLPVPSVRAGRAAIAKATGEAAS